MSENIEKKTTKGRPYECIPVKPDGKISWIIVVASFIINLIIDGFLYAFGAFSDNLKTHFNAQEWSVSFIISIACGFYLISAPLGSALCKRLGFGVVGIIGSILASTAIAISVYSPNIYFMWILFGVFGGIGMGLVYLPSILIVGHCFDEKRAIATGIVTAGTGIGSITFGPFSSFLFAAYGWKTALLILSAILLVCAVGSAVMVPLRLLSNDDDIKHSDETATAASSLGNGTTSGETVPEVTSSTNLSKSVSKSHETLKKDVEHNHSRISLASSKVSVSRKVSTGASLDSVAQHEIIQAGIAPVLLQSTSQFNTINHQETQTEPVKFADEKKSVSQNCTNLCLAGGDTGGNGQSRNLILIYFGNICSMIGYYTPYLFIVNYAVSERNVAREQAVFLLSLIGFTNTIARFFSGWIAKLPYMNAIRVNNIGLVVAGISTILVAFSSTHTHLIIYCVVWGGFIAFHVSMSPVIVCEIVGLEKFGSALGMTLMFRGITSFVAPTCMGGIRDLTSSFKIAFIIGGISFLVSAAFHCALRVKGQNDSDDAKNYTDENLTRRVKQEEEDEERIALNA